MSDDPNAGARRYLLDYLNRRDPGFAVLISAPWGAGKTHFVKSIIGELRLDRTTAPLMVSLFGAASKEDIERSMLLSRLSMIDNAATKAAAAAVGALGAAALRYIRIDLDLTDTLKQSAIIGLPETLIFDDLERASLEQRELLGFLNRFVERDQKRVILLANEEKLWNENGLAEKEKLVGRTLTIEADFEAAFGPIAAEIKDAAAKAFLVAERETIRATFHAAEHRNLRSLQQAIWEFERFFAAISERQKEKPEAMRYLLGHFLALTLEHKAGKLDRAALGDRQDGKYVPGSEAPEALARLDKKHGRSDFVGGFQAKGLPRDFATALVCDGRIDAGEVETALAAMAEFADPAAEEDWQTIIWALQRKDDVVYRAAEVFNKKFDSRYWNETGLLLHVFTCRLRLSEMGLLTATLNEVEEECRRYVDDLKTSERLDGGPLGRNSIAEESDFAFGYGSLSFPQKEAFGGSFGRVFDYLLQKRSEVRDAAILGQAADLTRLMSEDSRLFRSYLCQTGENDGRFARVPVLANLHPEDFATALLKLPVDDLRRVFGTLHTRHERDDGSLATERQWIRTTAEALRREAAGRSALTHWRINEHLKHYLDPLIAYWDPASDA